MRDAAVMWMTVVCGAVVVLAGCQSPAAPDGAGVPGPVQGGTPETYVFSTRPSWTGELETMDHADPATPGRRMVILTARAADGRHVVLVQSPTYNRVFRPRVRQGGVLVYTSPNGFKVWGGGPRKWYAGILLRSARAVIKDPPAENRTGYVLESPAGTFPALAVNGPVTDGELHELVDSLVPAQTNRGPVSDSAPPSGTP
jgi:hypothetical protein